MKGWTGSHTACDVHIAPCLTFPAQSFVNRYLLVPFFRDPVTNADQFAGVDNPPVSNGDFLPVFDAPQIISTAELAPEYLKSSDKNGDNSRDYCSVLFARYCPELKRPPLAVRVTWEVPGAREMWVNTILLKRQFPASHSPIPSRSLITGRKILYS